MKALLLIRGVLAIIAIGILGFFFSQNKISKPTPMTPSQSVTASSDNSVSAVSVIAQQLDTPWALAFLPDNSILFTERPGRIRFIDNSGKLDLTPITTVAGVKEIGEGGLLGLTLHPDFSTNHYLYLYYTYSSQGSDTLNRVVRMTYIDKKLSDEQIIIDKIPGAANHNGGRIKFGPDGYLYITTGDAENPSLSQNTKAMGGKILKVTADGKMAPGSPFNNLVYSYGHRNPQGLAWDKDGNLWETEHGRSSPTGFDELNLIEKGKNYGWPTIQGDETKQGMITPKYNSGPTTTWAPAGTAYLNGSLFFGGLKGQTLYEAVIQKDQVTALREYFTGEFGRIRDVVVGPDNLLYITTSNQDGRGTPGSTDDKIMKIDPAKLSTNSY
ncbi:hypothetical protein A2631_03300 [Candidatus Daviesbacteria bacterium RIFCSPHIGHO2_01_FULL_44_29]|uniref:Glucose/Sorbosone dehydrogenase domain-containing protein n=1 Tax=Candidatus Daviesbacteria bacterium RIFCSPHIGHO2_02_FULL_43_12 TaxID=1797776 RepID=A0A1F5KKQ0_9BACT|nr:MAG: hypothetical protein A2631_03300 [Candidatus Daviesbacteria bacterium RIFCSPHIGHO2_01_FULL_44_29]OGE40291.1 MAG: hypothetical protein A3E86_03780 [Candidatus Daviesbacteria bacterium RIFCSPHIGHO2_12_FULL_47_45]OGE41409.1 MAG: hypothetical protein A3D25_02695 [Candidatus Daviesbacteria bacterium RIFCSPHIGHO2_02_FULL_43_12]OGE69609.1 MAG: hypothetical protein A3B55_04440 [Candidatus Daviesbacteria bacterium RIFCSPLOWO2_01_FULL_43_15]